MMPVTQLSVVRAMQDRRPNGGRDRAFRTYVRTEYGEGDAAAFAMTARAGRVMPAERTTERAGSVSRAIAGLARALAAALGQPGGS